MLLYSIALDLARSTVTVRECYLYSYMYIYEYVKKKLAPQRTSAHLSTTAYPGNLCSHGS